MKQLNSLGTLISEIGTVEDLDQAFALYKNLGISASSTTQKTRVEYLNDVHDLVSFFRESGITHPQQMTLAHLRVYQAELERRGLKASTRNRKTYAVKDFFSFLHEYALIKDDIGKRLIPPAVERGEPRFLSEAEYSHLLQVCQANARDAAIIELFLQTGIRLSELAGLSVRDVTLPAIPSRDTGFAGSIRIKRRSGHAVIPLNHKASNAVRKWLEIREPILVTTLFLTGVKKPMGKRAIQLMLEKYLKEAEIEDASVQSLRHTMAVHHLAKGTPRKTLAEILGDDPATLDVYVPLARRVHQNVLQEHML